MGDPEWRADEDAGTAFRESDSRAGSFALGFGASGQLVRRDVFRVRCDPPVDPKGIDDAAATIAIKHVRRLHHRLGAGLDRLFVGLVDVINVEVHRGGHRLRWIASLPHHDDRIADRDLCVSGRAVRALMAESLLRPESLFEEIDQPVDSLHDQVRRDGVKALGDWFGRHFCSLLSKAEAVLTEPTQYNQTPRIERLISNDSGGKLPDCHLR
jgi:hypothetical protein